MQKAGKVEHVAGSGRVIVRLARAVDEGSVLCDRRGSAVARVAELVGPVSAPLASASAMTNSIARHVGRAVYEAAERPREDRRQRGGRGRPREDRRQRGGGGGGGARDGPPRRPAGGRGRR